MKTRTTATAVAIGLGFLVAPVIGGLALREVCTWNNSGGGSWNEPTNWNPQEVPDASGESAVIPDDGSGYTIELDTSPVIAWLSNDNPLATLNLNDKALVLEDAGASTNLGVIAANNGNALIYGDLENGVGGEIQVLAGQRIDWDDDDDPIDGVVLHNDGTITVNVESGASTTVLQFKTDAELAGEGEIVLNAEYGYAQVGCDSEISIYHDEDHTIRGKGDIAASMTNAGTIVADSDLVLRILPGVISGESVTFVNSAGGSISAVSNNLEIQSSSSFRNEGYVRSHASRSINVYNGDYVQTAGGVTRVDGRLHVRDGVFDLQSGSIRGDGLIEADVEVSGGTVFPGEIFSTGDLEITGDYTILGSGLFIDLASETDYDQIIVGGDAVVGGTLYIYAIEQYIPPEGTEFEIITGSNKQMTVDGEFDAVWASGVFDITYNPDNVTLTVVTPPKPADINGDGVVNVSDFLFLLFNWGPCPAECPPCDGDINYDCVVDVIDFLALIANWDPLP